MKKIFISLLALGCLVACTPKKTAYEQYIELYNNIDTQLEMVEDRAVVDSIIEDFVAQGYTLLMENLEDVTSDSIVLAHFYMLTPEQKAALFAAIPAERLEMPTLQPVYEEYQIELLTSAGNPYLDIVSLKADGTELALSDLVSKTDYVLVDFWASWCGPCRMFGPIFEAVSEKMPDVTFIKFEIDESNRRTPAKYGIRSIPSVLAFKNGELVEARSGLMDEDTVIDWIKELQNGN